MEDDIRPGGNAPDGVNGDSGPAPRQAGEAARARSEEEFVVIPAVQSSLQGVAHAPAKRSGDAGNREMVGIEHGADAAGGAEAGEVAG